MTRAPNKDIVEHTRKRQIEVELFTLRAELEDQGAGGLIFCIRFDDRRFVEEDIDVKVDEKRKELEAKMDEDVASKKIDETHMIALRKEKEMDTLRSAFGLSAVKEGDAFDRELQEKLRIEAREERDKKQREKEKADLKKEKDKMKAMKKRKKELKKFKKEAKKAEKKKAKEEKKRAEQEKLEAEERAKREAEEASRCESPIRDLGRFCHGTHTTDHTSTDPSSGQRRTTAKERVRPRKTSKCHRELVT
eukprot:1187065-Prorocentrum_minimum.AAC.3